MQALRAPILYSFLSLITFQVKSKYMVIQEAQYGTLSVHTDVLFKISTHENVMESSQPKSIYYVKCYSLQNSYEQCVTGLCSLYYVFRFFNFHESFYKILSPRNSIFYQCISNVFRCQVMLCFHFVLHISQNKIYHT